jgi:hypothetical protein
MPLNDENAREAIGAPWTISVNEGDQHITHDIKLQDVDRALECWLITYGPDVGALNTERITLIATRDHETHTFIRYFRRHFRGMSLSGTELLFRKPKEPLPDLPPLLHFCNSRFETIATIDVPEGTDPYTFAQNQLPTLQANGLLTNEPDPEKASGVTHARGTSNIWHARIDWYIAWTITEHPP